MAIAQYLAMTAAEIHENPQLPSHIGWMACHFSPYGTGLSNIPQSLPEDSLLILNDRTPIHGHDARIIARQLEETALRLRCRGILLDFQRPDTEEIPPLIHRILDTLPCPVAVSDLFAPQWACPVFLPPVPLHVPLREYITPWQGREIWLELAPDGETVTVTDQGATFAALRDAEIWEGGFVDETLHCHYQISTAEDQIQFSLQRRKEDLEALLEEAEALGIALTVGLYQEFWESI